MTKVVLLIILGPIFFILLSLAVLVFLPPFTASCDRTMIARAISPDNAWAALVYEDACNDGWFTTSHSDSVVLVRAGHTIDLRAPRTADEAVRSGTILLIAAPDRPEDRPIALWISPRNLQINLPTKTTIGHFSNFYQDVSIILKEASGDRIQ
jgi:hypothetical protein